MAWSLPLRYHSGMRNWRGADTLAGSVVVILVAACGEQESVREPPPWQEPAPSEEASPSGDSASECSCEDDARCWWARDLDGDGHLVSTPFDAPGAFPACSRVPAFFDCDDEDAEVHEMMRLDRDGDGYGGELVCSFQGAPDAVWWTRGGDCDDDDSTRTEIVYADADGDGWGVHELSACEPSGPNFARRSGDCDETDPSIPAALEYWNDGVDSDCDGSDGTEEIGNVYRSPGELVLDAPGCVGIDLVFSVENTLWDCDSDVLVIRIANAGTEPFVGRVSVLQLDWEGIRFDLDLSLDPGELSEAITMHARGSFGLTAEGVEDCDPSSNSFETEFCNLH